MIVVVSRPVGNGGVANYYDALRDYFPDNVIYCETNNPSANGLLAKIIGFPLILLKFLRLARGASIVCLNPSLDAKSYYRDMFLLIFSKLMKKKVVVFFRGWEDKFEEKIKCSLTQKYMFKKSYGRADAFIVLGDVFKRKLCGLGISSEMSFFKMTTVASGAEGYDVDITLRSASVVRDVNCLFMARLVSGKGIDEAIDMYIKFKAEMPDRNVSLTIAGDGPEQERIRRRIEDDNINNVNLCGYIRGKEKANTYKQMHLLIFPTAYGEGLPNAILEAMLYGLVIASTAVGGIPDIVKDGKNGVLVSLNNLSEAVTRLVSIFNDQNKVYEIACLNQQLAVDNFLPEKVASKFMHILEEVDDKK